MAAPENRTTEDMPSFDDFRAMALDAGLSPHEKIGFTNAVRSGQSALILQDLRAKLPALDSRSAVIVDVGCGCGELPQLLIDRSTDLDQKVVLIDSSEMLDQLPDAASSLKRPSQFPYDPSVVEEFSQQADAVIAYSVFQYVVRDQDPFEFFDSLLELVAPGGRVLIGDLPNASMRERFLRSEAGRAYHRGHMQTERPPEIPPRRPDDIDDALILELLDRARRSDFHAFVVPQDPGLPMANRREDVLIVRP